MRTAERAQNGNNKMTIQNIIRLTLNIDPFICSSHLCATHNNKTSKFLTSKYKYFEKKIVKTIYTGNFKTGDPNTFRDLKVLNNIHPTNNLIYDEYEICTKIQINHININTDNYLTVNG